MLAEVTPVWTLSPVRSRRLRPVVRHPQDPIRLPRHRHGHVARAIPAMTVAVCTGPSKSWLRRDDPGQNPARVFQLAETTEDEVERARQMTFVLVGAGPTGVELSTSLAQMVKKATLRRNFRRIDPAKADIILLDAGKRVLPTFSESCRAR